MSQVCMSHSDGPQEGRSLSLHCWTVLHLGASHETLKIDFQLYYRHSARLTVQFSSISEIHKARINFSLLRVTKQRLLSVLEIK